MHENPGNYREQGSDGDDGSDKEEEGNEGEEGTEEEEESNDEGLEYNPRIVVSPSAPQARPLIESSGVKITSKTSTMPMM